MKKTVLTLIGLMISMSALAEHWPTGYYRAVADPASTYFYNDEYRWYCHVQNATQSDLYDVEEQVRVVGDVYGFLSLASNLGECVWPDGFYTIGGDTPIIYRLYPGNICTITSEQMLAAYDGTDLVISAEENSDFFAHRNFIGQCYWPSL